MLPALSLFTRNQEIILKNIWPSSFLPWDYEEVSCFFQPHHLCSWASKRNHKIHYNSTHLFLSSSNIQSNYPIIKPTLRTNKLYQAWSGCHITSTEHWLDDIQYQGPQSSHSRSPLPGNIPTRFLLSQSRASLKTSQEDQKSTRNTTDSLALNIPSLS